MKIPGFIARAIQTEGDSCIIRISRRELKLVTAGLIILLVVAVGLGIWGLARQVEVVQLRQQTQLQQEQLRLLQQKTVILEKKMETLDSLDQEIRQMVKGSEAGSEPQGDGHMPDDAVQATSAEETISSADVATLSARLSRLDMDMQRRLASFYTLRSVLKDGAGDEIRTLQSTIYAAGNPNAANSTTPSIWPVNGVITSTFGSRTDPVLGGQGYHEGLDIANDYGTPIVATAAGTVTFAGYTTGGYGNLVEIDHGNGFVTRYGHNSVVLVSPGMHVDQGQTIALMGSTGKSTGSHSHYEVRINGTAVDPMLFLPIK